MTSIIAEGIRGRRRRKQAGWPRLRRWSSRCECTTSHTANADCQHTDPNHLGSVEQFRAGKLALDASRLPRLLALQAHRTAARDAFFTAASFCANADFCELPPPVPPFFARTFKKFSAPTLLTAHLSADRTWPVVRPDLLALPTMIWQGAAAAGRQTTLMARARTAAVCVPLPFVAKTVPLPCVFTSFAAETVPLPWCVFPLPFDAKTPPLPCGLPQVTSSLVFGNAMKVGTSHCLSSTSYCLPFLDLLPPSHCLSSTVHAPSPPLPFLLTVCRHPH